MLSEEEKARKQEVYRNRIKKQKRMSWIIIGTIFFFIFFGRIIWGPIGINISYSEGERKIQVVKITSKGLIWKTWEIEGIIAPGGNVVTTYVWNFSIDNKDPRKEELLQKLENAFDNGSTIRIQYEQRAGSVPWRSKTTYWVKNITMIE